MLSVATPYSRLVPALIRGTSCTRTKSTQYSTHGVSAGGRPVVYSGYIHRHPRRKFCRCSVSARIGEVSCCSKGSGPKPPGDGPFWWFIGGGGSGRPREISAAALALEATTGSEEVILLDVGGMMCGGCVGRVKKILEGHLAVKTASVNLATETALVRIIPPSTDPLASLDSIAGDLAQLLSAAGFVTSVRDPNAPSSAAAASMSRKRTERQARLATVTRNLAIAWILASTCLVGHLLHCWPGILAAPAAVQFLASTELHAVLSVATLLGPGRGILTDGAKALMQGRPDMNTLVGLGAVSALSVSTAAALLPTLGWKTFFEEPAMLLGVVLLGRTLEERAKLQASADMVALYNLLPSTARLVLNGGAATRNVPAEAISSGDTIRVLPGDRVPVDGVVESGRTTVDESALTGEPMPVTKKAGASITAGTINVDGAVTVRCEASGSATTIADIVRAVEGAQARTAPAQRLADDVSGKFAYAVMGLSAATFAFWSTLGTTLFPSVVTASYSGSPLLLSLQLACNVMVVACPCALGLATPTAVMVGTSAAAKRGLLIRGGDVLEAVAGVDTVVFDKTGTLTAGRPAVTGVVALGSTPAGGLRKGTMGEEELLAVAAAVEQETTHPLGRAVVSERDARGLARLSVEDGTLEQEPGSGISGVVDGRFVVVGTGEWLSRHASAAMQPTPAASAPAAGVTRAHVMVDGEAAGYIDLVDQPRPGATETVRQLRARGLRVVMLSGDDVAAAKAVGTALGFAEGEVFAGVKPKDKLARVEAMRATGARVAMVGDGINDTAALAAANVGIAMGCGVQAASEVADVILLSSKPSQVVDAIALSHATMDKIRQNLAWAFGYNLLGIPVAAGALLPGFGIALSPSISGALMGVSSLAVMGNSLLLRREATRASSVVDAPETPVQSGRRLSGSQNGSASAA